MCLPRRDRDEEGHPFRELKEGWQFVARGSGRPREKRLGASYVVKLDADLADWVGAEATAAGTDPITYIT